MELLADLITNPRLWSIITPAGLVTAILGYALYKMFVKYDRLQNLRIEDIKKFNDEYQTLTKDVNQTLDTLLKVIGNRNGNGGK